MSKWVMDQEPKRVPVPLDPDTYNQHIAEIAKILYRAFCQLDPRFKPAVIPTRQNSVPNGLNQEVRR